MMLTDTTVRTALQFDRFHRLPRNTPSLPQAIQQQLLMADGKHIDLFRQMKDVISNPIEMAGDTSTLLKRVMSCPEYRDQIRTLAGYTSVQKPHIDHVLSAITSYVGSFAFSSSPFDSMILAKKQLEPSVVRGFNLFMGKALCGTCHFVPQFGGVRPPYVGSEFEVLGTPVDTAYSAISQDSGRFMVHPVPEMLRAFRTPSLRNSALTAPYMHNGVFSSLTEVMEFYDAGGGAGKKLPVPNQTLDAEPLHLTEQEKKDLIAFLRSLTEDIRPGSPPEALPLSSIKSLRKRTPGGEY
jgi:cytochrome c peroxidase